MSQGYSSKDYLSEFTWSQQSSSYLYQQPPKTNTLTLEQFVLLNAELDRLTNIINDLSTENKALKQGVRTESELRVEIEMLRSENARLKVSGYGVYDLESRVASLTMEIQRLSTQLAEKIQEVEHWKLKYTNLELNGPKDTSLATENANLLAEVQKLKLDLSFYQTSGLHGIHQCKQLQGYTDDKALINLEKNEKELGELRAKAQRVDELEQRISVLLNEKQTETSPSNMDVQGLVSKVKNLEGEKRVLNDMMNEKIKEIGRIRYKLSGVEKKVEEVEKEKESLNNTIQEKEKIISELKAGVQAGETQATIALLSEESGRESLKMSERMRRAVPMDDMMSDSPVQATPSDNNNKGLTGTSNEESELKGKFCNLVNENELLNKILGNKNKEIVAITAQKNKEIQELRERLIAVSCESDLVNGLLMKKGKDSAGLLKEKDTTIEGLRQRISLLASESELVNTILTTKGRKENEQLNEKERDIQELKRKLALVSSESELVNRLLEQKGKGDVTGIANGESGDQGNEVKDLKSKLALLAAENEIVNRILTEKKKGNGAGDEKDTEIMQLKKMLALVLSESELVTSLLIQKGKQNVVENPQLQNEINELKAKLVMVSSESELVNGFLVQKSKRDSDSDNRKEGNERQELRARLNQMALENEFLTKLLLENRKKSPPLGAGEQNLDVEELRQKISLVVSENEIINSLLVKKGKETIEIVAENQKTVQELKERLSLFESQNETNNLLLNVRKETVISRTSTNAESQDELMELRKRISLLASENELANTVLFNKNKQSSTVIGQDELGEGRESDDLRTRLILLVSENELVHKILAKKTGEHIAKVNEKDRQIQELREKLTALNAESELVNGLLIKKGQECAVLLAEKDQTIQELRHKLTLLVSEIEILNGIFSQKSQRDVVNVDKQQEEIKDLKSKLALLTSENELVTKILLAQKNKGTGTRAGDEKDKEIMELKRKLHLVVSESELANTLLVQKRNTSFGVLAQSSQIDLPAKDNEVVIEMSRQNDDLKAKKAFVNLEQIDNFKANQQKLIAELTQKVSDYEQQVLLVRQLNNKVMILSEENERLKSIINEKDTEIKSLRKRMSYFIEIEEKLQANMQESTILDYRMKDVERSSKAISELQSHIGELNNEIKSFKAALKEKDEILEYCRGQYALLEHLYASAKEGTDQSSVINSKFQSQLAISAEQLTPRQGSHNHRRSISDSNRLNSIAKNLGFDMANLANIGDDAPILSRKVVRFI